MAAISQNCVLRVFSIYACHPRQSVSQSVILTNCFLIQKSPRSCRIFLKPLVEKTRGWTGAGSRLLVRGERRAERLRRRRRRGLRQPRRGPEERRLRRAGLLRRRGRRRADRQRREERLRRRSA